MEGRTFNLFTQENTTGVRRWTRELHVEDEEDLIKNLFYYDSLLSRLGLSKYFFLVAISADNGREEKYTIKGGDIFGAEGKKL